MDIIPYNGDIHKSKIDELTIGNIANTWSRGTLMALVKTYWDIFDADGINMHILRYEYTVDTCTNNPVYCRPPHCGHNESDIIMKHIKIFLVNRWAEECNTCGYDAPIVFAAKPHQETIDTIEDFYLVNVG